MQNNLKKDMTCLQRLEAVFEGLEPDYTPILGGWMACPEHICAITKTDSKQYWKNPIYLTVEAYRRLGTDGLIWIYVPKREDDYRFIDKGSYITSNANLSIEQVIDQIKLMPEPEKIEETYDFEEEYATFKNSLLDNQRLCGSMVWMPAQWDAGSHISWYAEFGFENFFYLAGMYEKEFRKLLEIGAAKGRCLALVISRAVKEGLYPKAILMGEDLCSQQGPMIDPSFLEKVWSPLLKYGIEPLLEVGCKPVWHCDGDTRAILDILIESGIKGFQGFQPECGMDIEYVAQKRTSDGKPLIIFGPLSVTTELPVCTAEQIKNKVKHAIQVCKGNANLVLFTSNTINPDVPLENIIAMYNARLEC